MTFYLNPSRYGNHNPLPSAGNERLITVIRRLFRSFALNKVDSDSNSSHWNAENTVNSGSRDCLPKLVRITYM